MERCLACEADAVGAVEAGTALDPARRFYPALLLGDWSGPANRTSNLLAVSVKTPADSFFGHIAQSPLVRGIITASAKAALIHRSDRIGLASEAALTVQP